MRFLVGTSRYVYGSLLMAGVLGAGWWWLRPEKPPDPAAMLVARAQAAPLEAVVEAVVVQQGDLPLETQSTGHLAPWKQVDLGAEIAGRIVRRRVEEGQVVADDQVLFELDDRDFRIDLEEARAELMRARSDYAVRLTPAPTIPVDTTRLHEARRAWQSVQAAHQQGQATDDALTQARRRFEAEELLAGQSREGVQAATTGLAQAEQRYARAQRMLERTRITAPFAGRVANLVAETGQQVSPGQRLLTLVADQPIKVEADVLEAGRVRLRPNQTARVWIPAVDSLPRTGRIVTLNPLVNPESGTGRVTVALPNPDGRLVAGLFARVELEAASLPDRLRVPPEALLVRQGRDLVFRIRAGRAVWTYVTTGVRTPRFVEIVEGLQPGDTVAVAGHFSLAHDAPVQLSLRP
jgi:HlyD family secretion protein